jgi:hypothetical protein
MVGLNNNDIGGAFSLSTICFFLLHRTSLSLLLLSVPNPSRSRQHLKTKYPSPLQLIDSKKEITVERSAAASAGRERNIEKWRAATALQVDVTAAVTFLINSNSFAG